MGGYHTMAFIQIRGKTKDKLNRVYTRHAFMIGDGVFISRPSSSLEMVSSTNNEEVVSSFMISDINGIDTTTTDILSTQDIVVGAILALLLAFGWSYLNGQSSSTSFVSWPSKNGDDTLSEDITTSIEDSDNENTFDAWKEISREENYVLYNTKIRQSIDEKKPTQQLETSNGQRIKLF